MVRPKALLLIENYIGVLHFQGVVLIRVRSEELGFVGQGDGVEREFWYQVYKFWYQVYDQ